MLRRLLRLFRARPSAPPPRPPDPRLEADPWLGRVFALLGDRYQLGADSPEGARVLRRTGRQRFNPMPVWLRAAERAVRGDYEVRGDLAAAKALLDQRVSARLSALGLGGWAAGKARLDQGVSARLSALGLGVAGDAVEEWAGSVPTRRYEGRCES